MSSSIDNITCPKCGKEALRETSHKTGEVHDYCQNCNYEQIPGGSEEIEEEEEEIDQKRYKLVNNTDGNNEIELESDTEDDALTEALEILGWSLVSYKDE